MVGAAGERIILDLRDVTTAKLVSLSSPIPHGMLKRGLREQFESYWSALAQQIRATRNDAGHPTSIDPVTADGLHASLLIFPELARLAGHLSEWVKSDLK
jgi:hypothetical protein